MPVCADQAVTIGGRATYDILDEDAMTSDSAISLPTQQSVKAYVDNEVAPKIEYVYGEIADVSSSASSWTVAPVAGNITKIWLVLEKAVTDANAAITFEIAGTAVTGGGITIAHATSAIGTIYSATPTAARTVTAGQAIELITNGGSSTASKATVLFEITPTATTTTAWKKYVFGEVADISSPASSWAIAPCAGTITKIYSVIDTAITVADAVLTFELGGTAVTGATITIATAGSASGTIDSCVPTALHTVAAGSAIEIITNGGSTDASKAVIMFEITPSE
jgi:hypothetical protein